MSSNPVAAKKGRLTNGKRAEIYYLNVGGTYFDVSRSTLIQIPYFGYLWNGDDDKTCHWEILKDRNDRIFIDREGDLFSNILRILRSTNSSFILDNFDRKQLKALSLEADYYSMTTLVQQIRDEYLVDPGIILGKDWVRCHKKDHFDWELGDGRVDNSVVEFNQGSSWFEVKKSNTYLVLFHHEADMPHISSLREKDDPLPHLSLESKEGVYYSIAKKSLVRIANIDIRRKKKVNWENVASCTHSGMDIIDLQARDKLMISGKGPWSRAHAMSRKLISSAAAAKAHQKLFHQVTMIPLQYGISPSRARLERVYPKKKKLSQIAKWSEVTNDGLLTLSEDCTKASTQYSGVYLVCSQVAVCITKESPTGFKVGSNDEAEHAWLEQNRASCPKYRRSMFSIETEREDDYDYYRKGNFQLGRMADVLICEKGDEISVRSEKRIVLYDEGIPFDRVHPNSCKNPEYLDLILLRNVQFQRFQNRRIGDDDDDITFTWERMDDEYHTMNCRNSDNDSSFVSISSEKIDQFSFKVPPTETTMNVLVLSTFTDICGEDKHERLGLKLNSELIAASHMIDHAGYNGCYHHLNAVINVGNDSVLEFCGLENWNNEEGIITEDEVSGGFLNNAFDSCNFVTFIKIDG